MTHLLLNIDTQAFSHMNLVMLFGLIIFGGTAASRLFQKLNIPQVVGCIIVGILLGDCFGLITSETIDRLKPFTMFALGIIGFMIGGELRGDVFKKYGKQFFIILFTQGIATFLFVAIGTSIIAWMIFDELYISIAMGLVFGAIASATAPAATVNVLWEYKTRGPLTAAVLAIVALDDGLALLLYRAAATGAKALTGEGQDSVLATTSLLLGEIIGSILLGFIMGLLLYYLLKVVKADDKILAFSIASLLIVVGTSMLFEIDPILPAMTLGITIANLAPRQSRNIFDLVSKVTPPVYTAFFVLAGAHMEFNNITFQLGAMIAVYTIARIAGKVIGTWVGAKYSGAPTVVRKYLGICLLPQAGVAIGLAILAGQQFSELLGQTIIMVVMTATFLMEIVGPMLVKVGVKKAGEVGMNVTEEDLIKAYNVQDVMNTKPTSITHDVPLQEILEIFGASDNVYYPVIDTESRIIGKITIAGIKEMFTNQDVAGWLLACDVCEPILDKTTPKESLEDAMERMQLYDLEDMPVVIENEDNKLAGVLNYRMVNRKISAEVLHRRNTADGIVASI